MKNLFICFYLLFTSYNIYANSDTALVYNDKIVSEQTKIKETIRAFISNPIDLSLTQIQTQAEISLAELNKLQPLDGSKDFLSAAKALFNFYLDITKNEYPKIVELNKNKAQYTSDQLSAKISEYTNTIAKKEIPFDTNFNIAQETFAAKYDIVILKNEIKEKSKKNK